MLFNYEFDLLQGETLEIRDALYYYRTNTDSVTRDEKNSTKVLQSHLRCLDLIKALYDKESSPKLSTVRACLAEIKLVMTLISSYPFSERKLYLKELCTKHVFPRAKSGTAFKLRLFTSTVSTFLSIICRLSKIRVFSWLLLLWSKVRSSTFVLKIKELIKCRMMRVS